MPIDFPDALVRRSRLQRIILVQPVTPQAYAVLGHYEADSRGTISIADDQFDDPRGPVATLDKAELSIEFGYGFAGPDGSSARLRQGFAPKARSSNLDY
jgi:hypothetical protein